MAAALASLADRDWERLRVLLHPYLRWTDRDENVTRGRSSVLAMLKREGAPSPPSAVELRDGQIYRWHG